MRLHAPEYNPFSFENYKILKFLIESGHELGYHSEVTDQAAIWKEDPTACFLRDIDVIDRMFNIKVAGVASHGGMTGLNNLDFWKDKKASDFGLAYEAYDKEPSFNLFDSPCLHHRRLVFGSRPIHQTIKFRDDCHHFGGNFGQFRRYSHVFHTYALVRRHF